MKAIGILLSVTLILSVQAFSQKLSVDPIKSKVEWTGKKIVGNSHHGELKLKSGQMEVKNDQIVKGTFVVDMNSLTDLDLDDKDYNAKLVGHLKSDDFFSVEKYPTATFTVKKSTKFNNNKATVTGDITIKGKTKEITAVINKVNSSTFTSKLEVDRSQFDVRYGSNSFFDNLGDKAIDNIFVLDITIVTNQLSAQK
ncbi:MAG: YceI family protein [Chloroflexota bacterium]|jgi:polyisoprenoid-binding protein YceI|nr:YceI family protein [Lentimicrobium sp.]